MDYIGKLQFYISKEEFNENLFEEILKTNDINPNLFNLIEQNKFELSNNRILAIKKEKKIFSELLMTPLIHDITLDYSNTKYLISDKRYFIVSYIKILLEENSDAIITIYG